MRARLGETQLHLRDLISPGAESTTCIGRGAFSTVVVMKVAATGESVAAKRIEMAKIRNPKLVINEKMILLNLQHPAIVKLLGTDKDSHHLYFILEYCANGSVRRQIELQIAGFEFPTIRAWAMQTLLGLKYLHEDRRIVHGDIKPANLLLCHLWNIKISDFGFACELAELNRSNREIGTKIHWAPEQIQKYEEKREVELTEKIDIWAFGVTFYQVAFLDHPFRAGTDIDLNRRIMNDEVSFPGGADSDFTHMLQLALAKSSKDRGRASELLQLPIFEGVDEASIFSGTHVAPDDDDDGDEGDHTQSLFESF